MSLSTHRKSNFGRGNRTTQAKSVRAAFGSCARCWALNYIHASLPVCMDVSGIYGTCFWCACVPKPVRDRKMMLVGLMVQTSLFSALLPTMSSYQFLSKELAFQQKYRIASSCQDGHVCDNIKFIRALVFTSSPRGTRTLQSLKVRMRFALTRLGEATTRHLGVLA